MAGTASWLLGDLDADAGTGTESRGFVRALAHRTWGVHAVLATGALGRTGAP